MRIITRTVLILSVVSLFADIASELLYPIIPVYLDSIGFSALSIGILEGIANFTAGISKGYFGKLSDEKGLRLPFVKLGYLLSAISKPIMVMLTSPFLVFIARTSDRLGKGIRTAARDALLSQQTTPENKGRVFGFHRSMDTVGATIGPALALLFLFFYPRQYTTIFYFAFIPGIISVLLIFLLKERKQPVSTFRDGHIFSYFRYWKIASPEYRKVVVGLLLFALFNSSDFFLLLKAKEAIGDEKIILMGITFNGVTISVAAYVFYNLIYALFSYPLGILADKAGFKNVILFGMLLFAIVYAGFAFNPSVPVIFALFFIYGLYAAATEGVIKAWITNMAHKDNTATAIGFYTSFESFCALFSSIIAGALWSGLGSFYTFASASLITIIVIIYFLFRIRRN